MSFINVFVSSPCRIGIKNSHLLVETDDGQNMYPIRDIDAVLIEDRRSTLSAYALSELTAHGVAVYVCDEKHMPTCLALPINRYCRPRSMLDMQLAISKPLKKQLWQSIVKCKIEGQARTLRMTGTEGAEELENMAKSVASDDSNNVEATAAAFYFKQLLNGQGRRNNDVFYNTGINYGYSIVRGLIARSLAVYGFETSLGLHHCNTLNAFNLADDITEPYRPFVDIWVYTYAPESELTASVKKQIFSLINGEIIIGGARYTLSDSADVFVQSLKRSFADGKNLLQLPQFEEPVLHRYA